MAATSQWILILAYRPLCLFLSAAVIFWIATSTGMSYTAKNGTMLSPIAK